MKKGLIIGMIFLLAQMSFGQGFIRLYEDRFLYGEVGQILSEAIGTNDNGFAFYTESQFNKADAGGNVIWSTPVGKNATFDGLYQPVLLADGSYFIATSMLPGGGKPLDFAGITYNKGGDTTSVKYVTIGGVQQFLQFLITQSGEYMWVGESNNPNEGMIVWTTPELDTIRTYRNRGWEAISAITEHPDGSFLVMYKQLNVVTGLAKISAQGNLIWERNYWNSNNLNFINHESLKILPTLDNNIVVFGYADIDPGNYNYAYTLLKLDYNGDTIWTKHILRDDSLGYIRAELHDIIETEDGGFLMVGRDEVYDNHPQGPFHIADKGIVIRADGNGDVVWQRDFYAGPDTYTDLRGVSKAADGGYYIYGRYDYTFSSNSEYEIPIIIKMDGFATNVTSQIVGNIFKDTDNDCFQNSTADGLQNWIVSATRTDGPAFYNRYAVTQSDGSYNLGLDTGTYELSFESPFPYWQSSNCAPTSHTVHMASFHDTARYDFPVFNTIDCPLMTVSVSTPFLRRCFSNTYTVSYCNSGTSIADSAYVTLDIDNFLIVNSASIPFTVDSLTGLYYFDIGQVIPGSCGSFTLNTTVDCNTTEIGQAHCVTAHIYPDSICIPPDPLWDGSSIEVDAQCDNGDTVRLKIENVGSAPTGTPLRHIIIEDNVMLVNGMKSFGVGEILRFNYPANGKTYTIMSQQSEGHPGLSFPLKSIEGCGTDSLGNISLGFVTQFPTDDGDPFVDIDCQENIGSFDPNDKQVTPSGVGLLGHISRGQQLEYRIRFQNTGTDTAFNVIILDTISPHLDLSTLQTGSTSHPYEIHILGDRVVEWAFPNILLPDSNVNEPLSHGFVKYTIEQEENLPVGTSVENSAGIYFDFNDPVITNTTRNTIAENFTTKLDTILINTTSQLIGNLSGIQVYPNPSNGSFSVQLNNYHQEQWQFELYDLLGNQVGVYRGVGDQLTVNQIPQERGLYLYRVILNGEQRASGKLVVQ